MPASSRRKGVAGEAEVRAIMEAAGFTLRGLESGGDWLAFREGRRPWQMETKYAERWKMGEWIVQLERDALPDAVRVLTMRRNRGEWYALLPLADLVGLL